MPIRLDLLRAKRATNAELKALVASATQEESIYDQLRKIGTGNDPQSIFNIMSRASYGQPRDLVDLTNALRQKWGHFQSVMQARELSVQALEWDIVPPPLGKRARPRARDLEAAKRLKQALELAEGWNDMIAHFVGDPVLFRHAFSEVIWKRESDNFLVPSQFKSIKTRRFGYHQETSEALFDPEGSEAFETDGVDLIRSFAPGKFIRVERRINGDVVTREGAARVIVWLASFATWTLADFMKFAEIAWKPWRRVVFDKKEAEKEDIELAKRILQTLNSSGAAMHPKSIDVILEWPRGQVGASQRNAHRSLFEMLGQELSKIILGGTLTVEAGEKGARSLGEVHNEVRREIRDADAKSIEYAIQRFLVEPFIRMNYGDSVAIPRFFFQTEDRMDLLSFGQALKELGVAGLRNIPSSYVRDQAGIPEARKGEEVLQPAVNNSEAGSGANALKPKPGDSKDESDSESDSEGED